MDEFEKQDEKKKLTSADFIFGEQAYQQKNDPYNLNTPFGTVEKQAFKKDHDALPNPWDNMGGDPFSGNTKKCPGCGANIFFDAESGAMICHSCGNVYDPTTMEMNGSLGIETPEQEYGIDDELDYEDQNKKEIVCNSCGSQIVTDANTAATICPFCGSPTLVTRRLTRQFRPDAIIPFSVTKEQAKKAYADHVNSVPHVPKSFTSSATIDKITGVYVPFWLVSADVKMDVGGWTHTVLDGSGFYDETKQETTHSHSLDVPIDGIVEFSLANVPFDGSKKISNRLMQACEPFDYSELVPYNASYLTGFLAEKYDCQPKDMYDYIKKRLDNYCHSIAETVKFEDCDAFTYNSSYTMINYKNYRVTYCLMPIWFLHLTYEDRNYQFAVNGQTGEVCGVVPSKMSWGFIWKGMSWIDGLKQSLSLKARGIIYALPSFILMLMYGVVRSGLQYGGARFSMTVLVIVLVAYLISLMLFIAVPPILQNHNRTKKQDPHNLDKAPEASFYLDTRRKISARKRITQGGEFGIRNPLGGAGNKFSSPFMGF